MERCTVAATQVDTRHLDVEHNLETHLLLIAETAEAGCDLVVFPETSVTGNNGCHDSDFFESWRILALKGAEVILLPHANRTMPAGGGVLTFDGRERELGEDDMLRAQEELLEARPSPPRLHDFLARDNGVFAVFSDMVGFDGHSTHVGGAYVLAPDGSMLAQSEPGTANQWIAVELDPTLVDEARENPWFALKKRRPEAYAELVSQQ